MKNRIILISLFFAAALMPLSVYAQFVMPGRSPMYGRSARNLGMGGVGVALDDNGKHAPFYNPAGLDDVNETLIELPFPTNMTIDFSSDSISLAKDTFDLKDDLDAAATDAEKIAIFERFLQKRFGKFDSMAITMPVFSLTRNRFAGGVFLEETFVFSFRDQSYPNFKIQSKTSGGGYLAGAYGFLEKLVQVGATIKIIYRRDIAQIVDAEVVTSPEGFGGTVDDDFSNGKVKVSVDLGAKTNLKIPALMEREGFRRIHRWLRPAFGVTYQDIGDVKFDSMTDQQSVSLGMAVHPDVGRFKNTVALDFRDINQDGTFPTKLHFGVETKTPWRISLRGGINQGYLSGGLGADLWIVRLDFATYAEETGFHSKHHGDRRIVFQISSEF